MLMSIILITILIIIMLILSITISIISSIIIIISSSIIINNSSKALRGDVEAVGPAGLTRRLTAVRTTPSPPT